jgi:hypothetical protein
VSICSVVVLCRNERIYHREQYRENVLQALCSTILHNLLLEHADVIFHLETLAVELAFAVFQT